MSCKLFCIFLSLGCILYVQGYKLTTSDRYALVGSPFNFTCRGLSYPRITWFVDEQNYTVKRQHSDNKCHILGKPPEEYTFYCSVDINILTIKSVKRSQQGTVWRCGLYRPDSNEVKLEVIDGPGSSLRVNSSSNITVDEGSDVTISCKADCVIKCLYRWELTNQIVSNNGLLGLTNITKFQDGVYTCTAVNPDTNQTAHTKIIINVKYQSNTHNREGLAIGIPVAVLAVVVFVVVVIRFRKVKSNHKVDDKGNDAPPEGDTDAYSSLMEQKNEETYVNINSDNQSENNSETN